MGDEVLSERRGNVEILTINRPEARNAINLAVATALSDALDAAERDEGCLVVILTGADDKAFSAGMDLKAFARGEAPITEQGFAGITKRNFPKPIIAAVNGSALAGGFEIMLSCDLVVAASHAKFGIPEASRGLIAGGGGLIRLAKRIPRAVALELALTAAPIDAERALAVGLINRVVSPRRWSSPSRSRRTPRSPSRSPRRSCSSRSSSTRRPAGSSTTRRSGRSAAHTTRWKGQSPSLRNVSPSGRVPR